MAGGAPGRAWALAGAKAIAMDDAARALLADLPRVDEAMALSLADRFRGGEGQAQFNLLFDRLAERVHGLAAERAGQGAGGLDRWAQAWETLQRLPREVEALNLDRADALFTALGELRQAARRLSDGRPMLIDSHVNLHAPQFDEDREAVIARALAGRRAADGQHLRQGLELREGARGRRRIRTSGARSAPIRTRPRKIPTSRRRRWSSWPRDPRVVGIGEMRPRFPLRPQPARHPGQGVPRPCRRGARDRPAAGGAHPRGRRRRWATSWRRNMPRARSAS